VNIRFACPVCDRPARLDLPGPAEWRCPGCDHAQPLPDAAPRSFPACAACGNGELYRKKDFPHGLGLLLLGGACLAFLVTSYLYHQWLAWAILLGSFLIDGVLYLLVGDVVVCYRCGAQHRGFPVNPEHRPYELTIGERYRQERLRREQLEAEKQ